MLALFGRGEGVAAIPIDAAHTTAEGGRDVQSSSAGKTFSMTFVPRRGSGPSCGVDSRQSENEEDIDQSFQDHPAGDQDALPTRITPRRWPS
jgi:hypothetical protein